MTEEKRVLEEGEARCIKGDGGTDGDGRQGGMLRGRRGGGGPEQGQLQFVWGRNVLNV